MKSTKRSISWLTMISLLVFSVGCQNDPTEDITDVGQFAPEVFANLTIEEFAELETPFDILLGEATNGRVASDSSFLAVIAALKGQLTSAKVLEIEEGEERGLPVFIIKFLLENEATLEVVIVQSLNEILEIDGKTGPFTYEVDPGGSFIALSEAYAIALASVDGEIVRWKLELEEENKWEYEIHVVNADGRFEIEIDAFSSAVLGVNLIDEENDDEFEEEEREDEVPEAIQDAIAAMIGGTIVHAEKKDKHDQLVWEVVVETGSGAQVFLTLTDDTADLILAEDEDGPFDYDLTIGEGFVGLLNTLETIETELEAKTKYWFYELIELEGIEYWAFIVKAQDPASEKMYKITIDATTGEWLAFESFFDDHGIELPENIVTAIDSMITGEVISIAREEENDVLTWKVFVKTESGAKVKLVITDNTEDLIFARDENGPFDYELNPGLDFITLQDALDSVQTELAAETFLWTFELIEIEEDAKWVYIIKVEGEQSKNKVTVDAIDGTWLFNEVID